MSVLILVAALVTTAPVRDPFWPVGYEGERRVISAEPRFGEKAAASEQPAEREATPAQVEPTVQVDLAEEWARREEEARTKLEMDNRWVAAVGQLRFGGMVTMAKGPSAVLINGRARAEGDYVRFDHNGYRFIWRVARSATERTLKLDRIKAVSLDEIKRKK